MGTVSRCFLCAPKPICLCRLCFLLIFPYTFAAFSVPDAVTHFGACVFALDSRVVTGRKITRRHPSCTNLITLCAFHTTVTGRGKHPTVLSLRFNSITLHLIRATTIGVDKSRSRAWNNKCQRATRRGIKLNSHARRHFTTRDYSPTIARVIITTRRLRLRSLPSDASLFSRFSLFRQAFRTPERRAGKCTSDQNEIITS